METLALAAERMLNFMPFYLHRMEKAAYSARLDLLSGASVGAHTRHVLDGYLCLLEGLPAGAVCYDRRKRDQALEDSPVAAGLVLREISAFLQSDPKDAPCVVTWDYGRGAHTINSTVHREIAHNTEHTIHHLAIIKIALTAHFGWTDLPHGFGVAPSTLAYRENSGRNALQAQPCTPANR